MLKTRIKDFYYKKATINDAPIIMEYIIKLAKYEKLEDEVTGNIDDIKNNMFNKEYANALILYEGNTVIGSVIYFYTFSTFNIKPGLYLEDLFIDEEYRNKGYGEEVFHQLTLIAHQQDCSRLEWVCLDWNVSSLAFYENKIKATPLKEWIKFRLDEDDIKKTAML